MTESARLSIGLFTIVPAGYRPDGEPSRTHVRNAILLAPVVGLLLGLGCALALFAVRKVLGFDQDSGAPGLHAMTGLLAAALTIGLLQSLVAGMHLDGLADTVDAMAVRGDNHRTLTIMRRSDIGPMGVISVVMTLFIQVCALSVTVIAGHGTIALVTAVVAGRLAAVWACRLPAARPAGLGAWVAGTIRWWQAAALTVVAIAVPLGLLFRDDDPRRAVIPFAVAAIPVSLVLGEVLQRWWIRRTGGITGDTIGAGVEVTTTAALCILALAS